MPSDLNNFDETLLLRDASVIGKSQENSWNMSCAWMTIQPAEAYLDHGKRNYEISCFGGVIDSCLNEVYSGCSLDGVPYA